ncbi:MAG TPA: DUF4136 domain-containing protein [Algoriphagus sp.]|uniref:DUF4136 domain-containing protein n=1 Tax=Algoriphagus sp. TaxID=1872435 RepID=UPI000EB8739D|nr:DUF4136 domain-containing protein [Algoriphagus sp.]HCD87402.1 DUF4136 domain-containing protein [Algoriphagus sp.]
MSLSKISVHLVCILAIGLCSCSSIDIFKENTEIAPVSNYKSFVIINQEVNMRGFSAQLLDEKVQDHLREALEAQGMVYDRTKPDLVIRNTSNEDQRMREINNFNYPMPFWGYRVWDPWTFNPYSSFNTPVRSSSYELLQVIVDFIDPKKDKFLMTLTGVTEVQSAKFKERKVLKTTDKILERFITDVLINSK